MTKRSTAGIVSAIRNSTTKALSSTINFIAKLSEFEAAMLCFVLGSVIGWFVGAVVL